MPQLAADRRQSGFTLLEILLVIVILSVTTMMVAPSFFAALGVSMKDEGQRLVQVLRLASEEASFSGRPFRLVLRKNSYAFERPDSSREWLPFEEEPYQSYQLSEGIQIIEVRPQPPLTDSSEDLIGEEKREPVLARLILPAEGILQISDIVMNQATDEISEQIVKLRPGPDGIGIKRDSE